jgi:Tfp pilus assembly protein PilN
MIRIDLLPEEHRRAERTPAGLLFATLGLVALFSTTAAACAWGYFSVVGGAETAVEQAQELLASKKPQADYCDKLEAEKKDFTERWNHIRSFSASRILWTKKMDQLTSLVDTPVESDRHQIWFESVEMNMSGVRDSGLKIGGRSASADISRMNNFHSDLAKGSFFTEFATISNPAGEMDQDDKFEPAESFKFEFGLGLKEAFSGEKDTGKKKPAAKPKATPPAPAK